jgi:hypothetical protein
MLAQFSMDRVSTNDLLDSGNVFLNGLSCSNGDFYLFVNDFIQLIVNIKFYIALRWMKNWFILRRNRINKIFYRKYRSSHSNRFIKTVRRLPSWFFDLQTAHTDLPKYFELDYFTLSIFVIHDELRHEKFTPSRAYLLDSQVLNMYNWKYIT